MPPIFFQLPKDEPSPADLVPDRYEAREVRVGLWRSYPWKREFGATFYSVACSGAVHAALIAVVLLTAMNLAPEKIEPVETLDSSLIKVKFVFHKKEEPVEKEVVKAPKKAPAIKPLVEKKKPEALAKKTPPPKKTPPRVKPKKKRKRIAKKSVPKTRQLAAGVSEEGQRRFERSTEGYKSGSRSPVRYGDRATEGGRGCSQRPGCRGTSRHARRRQRRLERSVCSLPCSGARVFQATFALPPTC